ncbi:sulfatase [Paraglaciecola aquimarina]|uniref:Sulfatase n=1 Tax=Paraglaciecola aquimarina TaxID=1235557 RepID=A0ABU3T2I3_9ALTE|nr:sulfatase [Paraglaciecola aquimarina]MDU0356435.1 sulfatase [Paraglaciecola aquimarina]
MSFEMADHTLGKTLSLGRYMLNKQYNFVFSKAVKFLAGVAIISFMSCSGTGEGTGKSAARTSHNKQPNFLWLISEDNSKHFLKLYNQAGASMPMVEELAEQGLIFDNAFSNAPVCSTARSTLATGAYAPRIGTLNHRTVKPVKLPVGFEPFSESLKKAGYYTTNNFKSDYNFAGLEAFWNKSEKGANWRERAENQPFFHIQSWKQTHEHTLHFAESDVQNVVTRHQPSEVELAPIYPDTAAFRYTQARYLDYHQDVDSEMSKVLDMLKQDGELENTFVFYFGDHGGVLPASKGYVFERGLNVPLIVRVPKNFRHLLSKDMQNPSNTHVDGFVSFIDFAPTLLELAGIEAKDYHDGRAFLGKNISLEALNKRDVSFSHADRFDEKSDLVRAVRKGNFKYIRNYQPFYADSLFAEYRYRQYAYREWKSLFQAGKLSPAQAAFFQPKAAEALYDIANDPHETRNLAQLPEYKGKLLTLRNMLQKEVKSWPDLGFYPESELVSQQTTQDLTAVGFGQISKSAIAKLIDIADLQLLTYQQAKPQLTQYLSSTNQWQRYWALIGLTSFGQQAAEFSQQIQQLANNDDSLHVKARAIEFLGLNKVIDPVGPLSDLIASTDNFYQQLELLNIATNLHEQVNAVFIRPAVNTWPEPAKGGAFRDRFFAVWLEARWAYISEKSNRLSSK